ncbi:dienelactone hydrolase family protein [Leucobacter sp. HY1908]
MVDVSHSPALAGTAPTAGRALMRRDVAYAGDGVSMRGMLIAQAGSRRSHAVLLVHDAFGLSDEMVATAERIARQGYPVFLADVWSERITPTSQDEIGPLIASMAGNRSSWHDRLTAALAAACAQPEIDPARVVGLGYCFGGSSVLELARTGAPLQGVIAIHAGLDLIEFDWTQAHALPVLLCTGDADPMATAEQRELLQRAMSAAGANWQTQLYAHAVHAFTSINAKNSPAPHVISYDAALARRAWRASLEFLDELESEHARTHLVPIG